MLMSGVALDEGMRWIDGARLPSTPNLNVDPEMLGLRVGRGVGTRRWVVENDVDTDDDGVGKEGDGDGDTDGISMVSGHSMYYSARSSVVGRSVRSSFEA
jgi:hypothetical protein